MLIHDQGLGDELFFLRFAPQLKARGAWLAYLPGEKLRPIVQRLSCIDRVLDDSEVQDDAAFRSLVGDLPLLLDMDEAAKIPPPLPLPALAEHIAPMRARLAALGPPPYVGVTWRAGSKDKKNMLFKECPLSELATILKDLPGTVLVLQRLPQPGEIESFSQALGRAAYDLSALNDDLEQMLALLSLLDDYVGVSNTNMHLMAGLGKTARVLVPHPPEWRWMAAGEESPWFRGFKVYRQALDRDWREAFERLRRDLLRSRLST
jgi:hypothetical protein